MSVPEDFALILLMLSMHSAQNVHTCGATVAQHLRSERGGLPPESSRGKELFLLSSLHQNERFGVKFVRLRGSDEWTVFFRRRCFLLKKAEIS